MDNTQFVLLDDGVLTNLAASGCLAKLAKGLAITFATLDSKSYAPVSSEIVEWKNVCDDLNADLLVDLCREIECDEATAVLVAQKRQCRLASDDTRVHTCWKRVGGTLESIWNTPQLIQTWSEQANTPLGEIANVIRAIEAKAFFRPRADCKLFKWWCNLSGS